MNNSIPATRNSGRNHLLKLCIFMTGLSGIVAEYVMSTLASYLIGNAVLQWTLTLSMMLFAMGVGSRASRYLRRHLLDLFIAVEFTLSLLCALSATLTYFLFGYIDAIYIVIYPIAIGIGFLIGLEIPLATRLNAVFEDLRINIASVMERDYYGALVGGLLFAFLALPYLGLSYTPILLASINFIVAAVLFWTFREKLHYRRALAITGGLLPVFLLALTIFSESIIHLGEQQQYRDKIIYLEQTPYQRIVMTEWKNDYWLFLNGSTQFSTYDEERYHEALVHPALLLSASKSRVLMLGGGDGMALREVWKHPDVQSVTLVDIDPAMTRLGASNEILRRYNEESLQDSRLRIVNRDAYAFLQQDSLLYDVIIIDLPDPKTISLARLYSRQFYELAARHLAQGGALVTQASSPMFARDAFLCVLATMRAAGLSAVAYHNHVPTMGEWGWVLGWNAPMPPNETKNALLQIDLTGIPTCFLDRDAMYSMLHFGKGTLERLPAVEINELQSLQLYHYYEAGRWDLF